MIYLKVRIQVFWGNTAFKPPGITLEQNIQKTSPSDVNGCDQEDRARDMFSESTCATSCHNSTRTAIYNACKISNISIQ